MNYTRKKCLPRTLALLLALYAFALPAAAQEAAGAEVFHPAYLSGFPDGTLRPDAPLTREQLAQALWRLIPEDTQSACETPACFSDVPPSRWSYEAVTAMVGLGILSETEVGRFSPEEGVTGPALAAALTRLSSSGKGARCLSALAEAWQTEEVTFQNGDGWVMGLSGTCFQPERALTRAEFAQILNRLLGRTPACLDDLMIGMPLWSDNLDAEAPFFLDMQEASSTHTALFSGGAEHWSGLG